ncbi:MAG: hypothetical protein M3157_02000 [Actinomycetota bacterium]|nr:hypothetical protein [Actinomycetota bacterium]
MAVIAILGILIAIAIIIWLGLLERRRGRGRHQPARLRPAPRAQQRD